MASVFFSCIMDNMNSNLQRVWLGKNPWGKVVSIASDVIKSLESMLITFLVRSSGQRSSNARMILTSSLTAKNSWIYFV